MRICFFMLKLFFTVAVYARGIGELLSSVLFSLCMVLWCDFIFFCVYVCLSQSFPFLANVSRPTSPFPSSITSAYFGCYSASWWLFCSHRNIASLSTGSHFLFLMLVFFCSLSFFLLALSLSHSSEFNVGAVISVAFRCRFCAYYISHLIRQIVVAASPASTKMEIICATFFYSVFINEAAYIWKSYVSFDTDISYFFSNAFVSVEFRFFFSISVHRLWTMTFHER